MPPLTEAEYKKKKLELLERIAVALESIDENVFKIWNDMPSPDENG